MTGAGHRIMGAIAMVATYHIAQGTGVSPILCAIGVMLGANAPDYLEIRYNGGKTLITHRTITHWIPLWVALLWFGLGQLNIVPLIGSAMLVPDPAIASVIVGFAMGGLLHLLLDIPNPMGVPLLTPFHRVSLGWWRSGQGEGLIIGVTILALLVYLSSFYQLQQWL